MPQLDTPPQPTRVNWRHLTTDRLSTANPEHAPAAVDRWDRQTDGRSSISLTLFYMLGGVSTKVIGQLV